MERRMHVFIDESGNFTGYQPRSISVVGALAIPDGNLPRLRGKYARIRKSLLKPVGKAVALGPVGAVEVAETERARLANR